MFNYILTLFFILISFSSCAKQTSAHNPEIFTKTFDFIKIGDSIATSVFTEKLDFTSQDRKDIYFSNCNEVLVFNFKDIATYEQFRFKLITSSCTSIYEYLNAKPSNTSYFPESFTNDFILSLPSNITPIINDYTFNLKNQKSIKQAYTVEVIQDKNHSHNILAPEDDLYIDIVARGDFNDDGIEDLLISSTWYARNARGKLTDLVIVTKKSRDRPIEITWRMYGANWGD